MSTHLILNEPNDSHKTIIFFTVILELIHFLLDFCSHRLNIQTQDTQLQHIKSIPQIMDLLDMVIRGMNNMLQIR